MKNASGGCRNLKLRARKRFSPFPPAAGHPPTRPFQKLRNAIEPLSGGIRGQTFCSTLQLSRSFKMLSWFYSGGFSGTSCVWENCLYRPGDKPLRSIGKAATSVLPPLTAIHLFSTQETLLQMSLWSRVRALPPLSIPMNLPTPEADLPKVMAASRP